MLGLLGVQVLFQSIVGASLLARSSRYVEQKNLAPQSPVATE
jgi:hypothetical protein